MRGIQKNKLMLQSYFFMSGRLQNNMFVHKQYQTEIQSEITILGI